MVVAAKCSKASKDELLFSYLTRSLRLAAVRQAQKLFNQSRQAFLHFFTFREGSLAREYAPAVQSNSYEIIGAGLLFTPAMLY